MSAVSAQPRRAPICSANSAGLGVGERFGNNLKFILVDNVPDARFGQHRDGMTVLLQDDTHLMHAGQAIRRAVPEPGDSSG